MSTRNGGDRITPAAPKQSHYVPPLHFLGATRKKCNCAGGKQPREREIEQMRNRSMFLCFFSIHCPIFSDSEQMVNCHKDSLTILFDPLPVFESSLAFDINCYRLQRASGEPKLSRNSVAKSAQSENDNLQIALVLKQLVAERLIKSMRATIRCTRCRVPPPPTPHPNPPRPASTGKRASAQAGKKRETARVPKCASALFSQR